MMRFLLLPFCFISALPSFSQDGWIQRDSIKGSGRSSAVTFSLNDDAYVLTGLDELSFKRSMVSYDVSQDDWDDELPLGGDAGDGLNRGSAVAFSAGGYGFCGLGTGSVDYFKDLWKYDPVLNTWTQMADFAGSARREAVSFVVGDIAYVGTGLSQAGLTNDFYAYDFATNDWSQIADFPGSPRRDAVSISMGGQGYVGTGIDASTYLDDFWCYFPLTDSWVQKADFPGTPRHGSVGFALFPNAFIALGEDNTFTYKKDVWEYNYFGDTWTQRTNFPGVGRAQAIAAVVQDRIYVGSGYSGTFHDDFYEYIFVLETDEQVAIQNNIYPNPAKEEFFVTTSTLAQESILQVFNSAGQEVTSEFEISISGTNQFQVGIPFLSKGVYYICVSDGNNNRNTKSVLIQ